MTAKKSVKSPHERHNRVARRMVGGQIASLFMMVAAALLFIFSDIYRSGTGLVGVVILFGLGALGWRRWTYYRNHHKVLAQKAKH